MRKRQIEGEIEGNHRTTLGGGGSSTQMATKRKYKIELKQKDAVAV